MCYQILMLQGVATSALKCVQLRIKVTSVYNYDCEVLLFMGIYATYINTQERTSSFTQLTIRRDFGTQVKNGAYK